MRDRKERQEARARQRAEVILDVRAGKMTAKDAAEALGVSRKTYYEWERRALSGMLQALSNGLPGRPEKKRDPEKEELRQKVEDLQQKLLLSEQVEEIRKLMEGVKELDAPPGKKKRRRLT